MPSISTMRRLALIKYMYNRAVQQSRQRGDLGGVAVLDFHDCVEIFLSLAAEELPGSVKPGIGFLEYWGEISKKSDVNLSHKAAMERLNKARVGFKHYGTLPASSEIERFREQVSEFFDQNTQTIFKIAFADISLVELIIYEGCKAHVRESQRLAHEGDFSSAYDRIHVAFHKLVSEFDAQIGDERYPVFTIPRPTPPKSIPASLGLGPAFGADSAREYNALSSRIDRLNNGMFAFSTGLDYIKYMRFIRRSPHILTDAAGEPVTIPRDPQYKTVTEATYEFAHEFVVESAIRLQEYAKQVQ